MYRRTVSLSSQNPALVFITSTSKFGDHLVIKEYRRFSVHVCLTCSCWCSTRRHWGSTSGSSWWLVRLWWPTGRIYHRGQRVPQRMGTHSSGRNSWPISFYLHALWLTSLLRHSTVHIYWWRRFGHGLSFVQKSWRKTDFLDVECAFDFVSQPCRRRALWSTSDEWKRRSVECSRSCWMEGKVLFVRSDRVSSDNTEGREESGLWSVFKGVRS